MTIEDGFFLLSKTDTENSDTRSPELTKESLWQRDGVTTLVCCPQTEAFYV